MNWKDCNCDIDHSPDIPPSHSSADIFSMMATSERELTYRIEFSGDIKVGGKNVPRQQVRDIIKDFLKVAYGDKLAIYFKEKTSGYANYVYKIWPDPDNYRGTFRGNQSITLNSRAPWSLGGLAQIAGHEIGHSWDFFGLGHNSGSFWEVVKGKNTRFSHLMHPDDGRTPKYARYPTFTSPEETSRLIRRYGKQVTPEPEPEPEPPIPEPEPEPPIPEPEPPMPDPNEEELKLLKVERKERQELREKLALNLAILRAARDKLKEDLAIKNKEVQSSMIDRSENEARIKAINTRIAELKSI